MTLETDWIKRAIAGLIVTITIFGFSMFFRTDFLWIALEYENRDFQEYVEPATDMVISGLLFLGADANAEKEQNRGSVLETAISLGRQNMVIKLLDYGANVNHQDKAGWTPLMIAASTGHTSIVQILLNRGADVDRNDMHAFNALMFAALGDKRAIVKLLLDKKPNLAGLDLESKSILGITFKDKKMDDLLSDAQKKDIKYDPTKYTTMQARKRKRWRKKRGK